LTELPGKLAIAVTFHYERTRLKFLQRVAEEFPNLAREAAVWVITNDSRDSVTREIKDAVSLRPLNIVRPSHLGHPFLLTWAHQAIFSELVQQDPSYSHFLYIEDDLLVTRDNIEYWLEASEKLAPFGLIPGFVRFEVTPDGREVSSDIRKVHKYFEMPRVEFSSHAYVNFRTPYQGMYLMSRKLISEFYSSQSYSPDNKTKWGIREKATQALIFENVPQGCVNRSFVGYQAGKGVDPRSKVHHLPNNYAAYAFEHGTRFGSLAIQDLIWHPVDGVRAIFSRVFSRLSLFVRRRKIMVARVE